MITLEDIKHDLDKDEIVIDFSYEGNGINIDKAQFRLPKNEWIAYKKINVPDEEMVQDMLYRELDYMIDYLGD